MTVGNQATTASINTNLSNLAVNLRSNLQAVLNFQQFVVSLGTAGLEALGFDAADAATVLSDASYMNTVAQVFFGTGTQSAEFNFNNELCPLWAGQ
jgi:hypothetical protein